MAEAAGLLCTDNNPALRINVGEAMAAYSDRTQALPSHAAVSHGHLALAPSWPFS